MAAEEVAAAPVPAEEEELGTSRWVVLEDEPDDTGLFSVDPWMLHKAL